MERPVMIGASVPSGVEQMKTFSKLKLGECALTSLPTDKTEALAVARYCKKHGITLYFSELLYRGTTDLCFAAQKRMPREEFYTKAELEDIFDAAGEYYGGRMTLGEAGGMLYWLKAWTINRRAQCYENVKPVQTMEEARDAYVTYLKKYIDYEKRELGRGPLLDVDSALVFKYHAQAGIDVLCHEAMPGDPHLMQSAIRGAARAYDKRWRTNITMKNYGGVWVDDIWQKRWKTSLFYCYITGANFIWPESGHLFYTNGSGQELSFNHPEMKRSRRTLREAYQFSRTHTRPPNGPRVGVGVVYGNLDGAPGLWNKYVWGQYKGRKWLAGPAEEGWKFVDKFHRKEEWPNEAVQGERDFSGNPPYGQYDVAPIEAPLDVLKSYPCLIFLGWNTMTAEIYRKLKEYVTAGGHLVMSVPHLSTHTDRAHDLKLFRNGDFRDLFGVKVLGKGKRAVMGIKCMARSSLPAYKFPRWRIRTDPRFIGEITPARAKVTTARVISGYDDFYFISPEDLAAQPILVENAVGKGTAFLVTAWQYPGDDGMRLFTEDVLRTVLAGEQGTIRLLASDRVRYAVYDGTVQRRKYSVVYLLNTDPDCDCLARLWVKGKITNAFEIPANELRIAYCCGDLVLVPEEKCTDLKAWTAAKTRQEFEFFSVRNQNLEIHNLGKKKLAVSVNGKAVACDAGSRAVLALERSVDPSRKEFFARSFLEEPKVQFTRSGTPY